MHTRTMAKIRAHRGKVVVNSTTTTRVDQDGVLHVHWRAANECVDRGLISVSRDGSIHVKRNPPAEDA